MRAYDESYSAHTHLQLMKVAWNTDDLIGQYDSLTLHRVPGPRSFAYFVPIISTFLALLISPSRLPLQWLRYAVLPAILACQAYVWMNHQSFDVISMQTSLTSFTLLGWYDVRGIFKRIKRSGSRTFAPLQVIAYPSQIKARASWIGILMISPQFKDFLIGQRTHDARESNTKAPMSFWKYLRRTSSNCLFSYLLLDVTSYLIQSRRSIPCLLQPGLECDLTFRSLFTEGFLCWLHVYAAASFLLAYLPSLIVLLVISPFPQFRYHPSISPVVLNRPFGPIASIWDVVGSRKVWGVRAFWGIFWHQNMRYVTSAPGLALASLFRLRKPSFAFYMVVVSQAFFWSGTIHAGMVPPMPLQTPWSVTHLRLRLASFFWLQAVGVALEMVVESAVRKPHPVVVDDITNQATPVKRLVLLKLLAFIWTWLFLMTTLWLTVLPVGRELGWWLLHPIPISLTDQVLDTIN